MRTVTVNGKTFDIHPLTWGQTKAFQKLEGEKQIDAVLAAQGVAAEDVDALPTQGVLAIARAAWAETYGSAEEEKN